MQGPILLAFVLALAAPAHANPSAAPDDLERLLLEKGLLLRLEQVRQNATEQAATLVFNALGFLGRPYLRGGTTAETGFDCSGFVKAMYEQSADTVLPRSAAQQAAATQKIERAELQPGDLVFFNTMHRTFSHVGIYVGGGKFVHSPKPGAEVRVDDMAQTYWRKRFDGARRVQTRQ